MNVVGAVLAGGRSARMGTTKALVEYRGTAMAVLVARALRAAGCAPVLLVGEPADLAALDDEFDAIVPDGRSGRPGPLAGIETALVYAGARGADAVAVLACDVPDVTAEVVRSLLAVSAGATSADVVLTDGARADVVLADSGRIEPLCAVWRVSALDAVTAALDDDRAAVHAVVDRLRSVHVSVDADLVRNVNRPTDLR